MQRVRRIPLDKKVCAYLVKRKGVVGARGRAGTLNVESEWKYSRKTKSIERVLAALKVMAGGRERCMYCLDSHGTDIEHFWPKATYPRRMFSWLNMLLCCTECGRYKGERFPLAGRRPLIVDPTKEEPWDYLDFDPVTGNISAKFDIVNNRYFAKGEETVSVLHFDRREAMALGYKRTYARIRRVIDCYLQAPHQSVADLIEELRVEDDHGLLGWVIIGTGKNVAPFSQLRAQHPPVWLALEALF